MRRTVATILAVAALTAVAATGLPVGAAAASAPVADRTTGRTSAGHGTAAPTHRNPVALSLPDGETAASCADPTAIRGVGRDRNWYLYCTTDALTATEQNADGSLVQHGVPTYRSTDLTHWTYVNDAFPTRPAWVGAANGIWAPDVVYRAGERGRPGTWYLYYAASDTPSASAATGGDQRSASRRARARPVRGRTPEAPSSLRRRPRTAPGSDGRSTPRSSPTRAPRTCTSAATSVASTSAPSAPTDSGRTPRANGRSRSTTGTRART